jgi:hypothetical protein
MIAFGPGRVSPRRQGGRGPGGDLLDADQRLDVLGGKVLRIDVDVPDTEQYRIPRGRLRQGARLDASVP